MLYPGMVDSSIEIFKHNNEIKIIEDGQIKNFDQASNSVIETIQSFIDGKPIVKAALEQMHPNNPKLQLEQFASCRLGGLDINPDIKDGILQDGEYHECPKRSECPFDGILCKLPVINDHRFTMVEINIWRLTSTDMLNEVIGEVLDLPMGTLHKIKKNIYKILGIATKQEGALLAKEFNII